MPFRDHPFFATLMDALHQEPSVAGRLLSTNRGIAEIRDSTGHTPLHRCAQAGFADLVAFLIQHGACVDTANDLLSTPLIDAAKCGHAEVVRLLVESGADQRASERSGDTALAGAALCHRSEIVAWLIGRGCPVAELIDESNALAIMAGGGEIAAMLVRAGMRVPMPAAA